MRRMTGFSAMLMLMLGGTALAQMPPAPPATTPAGSPAEAAVPRPAALVADGIPDVPLALTRATRPYMEFRSAGFSGWDVNDRSMLIGTRFGDTAQLHKVAAPGAARRQISFEAEPIGGGSYARRTGDVLVVAMDVGGSEFDQLYTVANGQLTLLTDGTSRNNLDAWTHDGRMIAFTSNRRNGTDSDIYMMDPRDPSSARMVSQVAGGGWGLADFTPDGRRALVVEYLSVTRSNLYELDVANGRMRRISQGDAEVSWGGGRFAPDGTLWITSDEGSDFSRLGTLDMASGRFTPVSREERWDVASFDLAPDGRFLVYVVNEAGAAKMRIMDLTGDRRVREVPLPAGVAGGVEIAPWGTIGFTLSSATSPADAWSVDPETLALTRWTESETGGLDANLNREAELVEVESFDGERVSGFLYRPDPARFPGQRPLIVNIHGGPEGQSRPGFLGRNNYLLNELGVAIFYPNVRGSTGYGKRFVALDNGPFKREDSVQDIGAFLDRLDDDGALDPARFAVTGGSYGGYMCYAVAIRYGERLRGANCIVAISNFVTFLENTQSYRRDLRRVEYGDERVPEQRAKLTEISPLTRVSDLAIPLMVVTGANDPRVPASEADQIVQAVRAGGRTAWHLVGQNEGHGFARKENADYQFWTSLMFWQDTLLSGADLHVAPTPPPVE